MNYRVRTGMRDPEVAASNGVHRQHHGLWLRLVVHLGALTDGKSPQRGRQGLSLPCLLLRGLLVMLWLSDSSDTSKKKYDHDNKSRFQLRFCGRIRTKCCPFLHLGCWVEVLVVGGGYRVERPHPTFSIPVN